MPTKSNWLDLKLTPEQEKEVDEGAALYKAQYIETIDTVFKIARSIQILQDKNYGTGVQGGFATALMQKGFTTRNGLDPIDPSIRADFRTLLENKEEVRKWWNSEVANDKKRVWTSARSIARGWKASKKEPRTATTRSNRITPAEPKLEAWAKPGSGKPSPERMQAKEKAEAEAEAKKLAAQEAAKSDTLDKLREKNRTLEIKVVGLENEIADLKAPELTADQCVDRLIALLQKPTKETVKAVQRLSTSLTAKTKGQGLHTLTLDFSSDKPKAKQSGKKA
jgi:hypothetical protein